MFLTSTLMLMGLLSPSVTPSTSGTYASYTHKADFQYSDNFLANSIYYDNKDLVAKSSINIQGELYFNDDSDYCFTTSELGFYVDLVQMTTNTTVVSFNGTLNFVTTQYNAVDGLQNWSLQFRFDNEPTSISYQSYIVQLADGGGTYPPFTYSLASGNPVPYYDFELFFDSSYLATYIVQYTSNEASYSSAYIDGYNAGQSEGYNNGLSDGYTNGYSDGYRNASDQGSATTAIFTGIINVALLPINFFLAIFNFEVFGINIGAFVASLMTIAVVVILFRTIFSGGNKSND